MNRTISININGIVFNIEEDAYQLLVNYLNEIKEHFDNSEDGSEIIKDIESRITELFIEKQSDSNSVISVLDVNQVIKTMGRPHEYSEGDFDSSQQFEQEEKQKKSTTSEKVKSKKQEGKKGSEKRIFRDPDTAIIGGVAAGIAAYIGIDPTIVRIIFVLLFLSGPGTVVYLVLWIVIPEAKTTTDKLKMKGEPINIENIRHHVEGLQENLEKTAKKINRNRIKKELRSANNSAKTFVDLIVKLIKKVMSVFLIFSGLTLLMLLFGVFVNGSFFHILPIFDSSNGIFGFLNNYLENPDTIYFIYVTAFLLLGIPALGLIITGFRWIFNLRSNKYLGVTMFTLWITSIVLAVFIIGSTINTIQARNSFEVNKALSFQGDTLVLTNITPMEVEKSLEQIITYVDQNDFQKLAGKSKIRLKAIDSTKKFQVQVSYRAQGHDKQEALKNAKNIDYQFTDEKGILGISTHFSIKENQKIRNQKADITLLIPENKIIYMEDHFEGFLRHGTLSVDYFTSEMQGHHWQMTKEMLICLDCEESL